MHKSGREGGRQKASEDEAHAAALPRGVEREKEGTGEQDMLFQGQLVFTFLVY